MGKRIPALCLGLAALLLLAGCGGSGAQADPSAGEQTGLEDAASQAPFTPRGAVLLEQGGLKITVEDFYQQEDLGIDIELLLENTSAQDLDVSASSCSVNGYMTGVYFRCQAPAGDTVQSALTVYAQELSALGVTQLADVSLRFSLDSSDGRHSVVTAAPLTTPQAQQYDYSASLLAAALSDSSGWADAQGFQILHAATETLYDQDGVSLTAAGVLADSLGGRSLRLELANSGPEQTAVAVGDLSVNGVALAPGNLGRYAIGPGKRYLVVIDLDHITAQDPQGDYTQLREIALTVNGSPVTLSVSE